MRLSSLADSLRHIAALAIATGSLGCSGGDDSASSTPGGAGGSGGAMGGAGSGAAAGQGGSDVRDVSPTPPEAGADVMRVELEEVRVEAGQELQVCHYIEPLEEETFMVTFGAHQGDGGHHLLAFRALDPKPAGTVEDCTAPEKMATLIPAVFSAEFGTTDFPPGMAVRLPAGEQLVIQQHYVNTAPYAMVARDVADFTFVPASEVTTELGFYTITDVGFTISPNPAAQTVSVECEAGMDMNFLMAGPHMHETGSSIHVTLESADGTSSLVDIPDWDPEYRDLPPVSDFSTSPVAVRTGDRLTLSCTFENDTGEELGFPAEMCAVYGYFYPGSETTTWLCTPN